MFEIAQDKEFGGFNLSNKGFILALQLLWIEQFLKEYLGYYNGNIITKTNINLQILILSRFINHC